MRAGRLRHRVTIQRPNVVAGDYDDAVQDEDEPWTDVATVWASVEPVSGMEKWRGMEVTPETSHMVELRYYPGLTSDMRLKYGTRYLNIGSVRDPEERNIRLILSCTERGT